MWFEWLVTMVFAIVLVILWIVMRARRVDQLHRQVERSRAILFQHLKNRRGLLDQVLSQATQSQLDTLELKHLLQTPPPGHQDHTETSESAISKWIGAAWNSIEQDYEATAEELRHNAFELSAARRFYNQQVAQTVRLRGRADVALFHLAGRAPLPMPYDFDDEVPSA